MKILLTNTWNPTLFRVVLFALAWVSSSKMALTQTTDTLYRINERLLIDLPVFDYPFARSAARMAANKHNGEWSGNGENINAGDWLRGIESPSMGQALAVTKDLHSTNYYFNNKLWNAWLPPVGRKKYLLNRLAANATAGVADYLLAYHVMVFGPVWMHEEFHRNGLTLQGISSFDDTYYRFGGGGWAGGSVSKVKDADLIRFKAEAPEELVRSFAAGIEGQYALIRNLQKDNFFYRADHPNVAMNILLTNQAVNYVRQFQKPGYDAGIDSMNFYGKEMMDRDFVGWDLTAWVYDLHRPAEPYTDRGQHPYGEGIDRIIKRGDLTPQEDEYLLKMGKLQYLNFLSPTMIGVHRIRLNDRTRFNFALRHVLTSFGYDLGGDIFLDLNGRQWLIGMHTYHNQGQVFGGLEVERVGMQFPLGKRGLEMDARAMFWVQPEKANFYAEKGKPGGLLQIRAHFPLSEYFALYLEGEGKSEGWVSANPYLQENLSLRIGLSLDLP